MVDAALERGWEIVPHNFVQTELLTDHMFDEDMNGKSFGPLSTSTSRFVERKRRVTFQFPPVDLNTIDILAEEDLSLSRIF